VADITQLRYGGWYYTVVIRWLILHSCDTVVDITQLWYSGRY